MVRREVVGRDRPSNVALLGQDMWGNSPIPADIRLGWSLGRGSICGAEKVDLI